MDVKAFRSLVDELSLKAFPFVPVIYSALFYFVEKGAAYRKAVLEMPTLPGPEPVANKPDEFINDFLAVHAPFALAEPNLPARRLIFSRLYPILGLQDPFLTTLFREELDGGDLQTIVQSFDLRVSAAISSIPLPSSNPEFWKALDSFVETAAGLALNLVRGREVQDLILERVRRFLGITEKK
jgi:hypothetical protein